MQAKIFDPFFTTKEVGKGTGLGTQRRVRHRAGARRAHLGQLASPVDGASFFVELPVARPTAAVAQGSGAGPDSDSRRFSGLKALVVEDEPALATAVAEALADAGFQPSIALRDGEEGLIARHPGHLRSDRLRSEDAPD